MLNFNAPASDRTDTAILPVPVVLSVEAMTIHVRINDGVSGAMRAVLE